MVEWLRTGATIATPLALLGLLIVAILSGYIAKLKAQKAKFEKLPADERAGQIDEMLTRYQLDGSNFTKEQKFNLISREMDLRYSKFKWTLIVFVIAVLALFAMAVWSYYSRPDLPPQVAIVNVSSSGQLIKKKFKLSFFDDQGRKHEILGTNGTATITLHSSVRLLRSAAIEMPCYKRKEANPIEIIEGKAIDIELERSPTLIPEHPLMPGKIPNLLALIPVEDLPSPGQLKATPVVEDSGQIVLESENNTEGVIKLLLHSFDEKRTTPLRVIMSDHCVIKRFNKFNESIGWFAFFAQTASGDVHYLGCRDLYSKSRTQLVLEKHDNNIVGIFH